MTDLTHKQILLLYRTLDKYGTGLEFTHLHPLFESAGYSETEARSIFAMNVKSFVGKINLDEFKAILNIVHNRLESQSHKTNVHTKIKLSSFERKKTKTTQSAFVEGNNQEKNVQTLKTSNKMIPNYDYALEYSPIKHSAPVMRRPHSLRELSRLNSTKDKPTQRNSKNNDSSRNMLMRQSSANIPRQMSGDVVEQMNSLNNRTVNISQVFNFLSEVMLNDFKFECAIVVNYSANRQLIKNIKKYFKQIFYTANHTTLLLVQDRLMKNEKLEIIFLDSYDCFDIICDLRNSGYSGMIVVINSGDLGRDDIIEIIESGVDKVISRADSPTQVEKVLAGTVHARTLAYTSLH